MKYRTNIIFVIFLLALVVFGYFWYARIKAAPSQSEAAFKENVVYGQDFLSTVNKLRTIELDLSFFSDEFFKSLKNITPEVEIPQTTGRQNPFMPIAL